MGAPPKEVLSVRVDQDAKAYLERRAAEEGTTVSALASRLLGAPSWSEALRTVFAGVEDDAAIEQRAATAVLPALAFVDRDLLNATAEGLDRLADRWPR